MKWLRWIESTKARERELEEEIEADFALAIQQRLEAGITREEAKLAARRDFGNVTRVKEVTKEMWGWAPVERLIRDVRHSLRRLCKAPAFTVTTVLTLALGIGATTSIFTLVHAVLLKSLEVANPGELYRLGKEARCCFWPAYSQDDEFSLVSYDLYRYLREHTEGFAELAAFQAGRPLVGVTRSGSVERAQSYPGEFVSGNYFEMFGIEAYAGRMLTGSDDQPNAAPVAVMSYRLWQQRYGSDPSVIGSTFNIDEKPVTVVGVTRPGFFGDTLSDNPPDFFLPLNSEPLVESEDHLHDTQTAWLDLIGRIRPGAKPAAIQAQMRLELKQWLRSHWGEMTANDRAKFSEQTLYLRPGGSGISSMREQYERWLQILMTVSGFVLLIVCANVANLMLVHGMERRRQISLSMALGAQSMRLIRQAFTESILLSLLGGAAGLAIAFAGTRLILHFTFRSAPGMAGVPISASPSVPVLLFAFGVALLTGIVFGIAPAWVATRVDPIEALRGAGRSTRNTGALPRKALVVFQAALSLVLLSASGLLTAALHKLENQDFGFDQNRRIIAHTDPSLAGYRLPQLTPLYRRIHDALSSIPGVSGVALCMYSPMTGTDWGEGVWVDGRAAPGPRDDNYANFDRVTPGYLDVIGNPIVRGRDISEQDIQTSRHVAVVNETFARKFFKNEDPIGRHFGHDGVGSEHEYEIVGIAKNTRYSSFNLTKPVAAFYLLPAAQYDVDPKTGLPVNDQGSHFMRDIVIVTRPGASLSDAQVRQAMASVDPSLPVISIRTLKEQVAGQFRQERLIARLTSLFGVLSLVLSCVGLYGVTAYNAGSRTSEIAVRMALGANRRNVVLLVLRGAFALISLGLIIGLPLTFAAGKFLGSQLHGMNPYNPVVVFIAVTTLASSAFVASLIPALRSSWIAPLQALRSE
jgi:predicted permease